MNDPIIHLFPVLVLCGLFFVRLIANAQLRRRRLIREARTLTAMLGVELQSLREHYHDNLAILTRGGAALLSLRAPGQMFRNSAVRLAGVLSPDIMTALVAVYTHHERVESLMQRCLRARNPRNPVPAALQANLDRLDEKLVIGCKLIEAASDALGHARPMPYGNTVEEAYAGLTAYDEDEAASPARPLAPAAPLAGVRDAAGPAR